MEPDDQLRRVERTAIVTCLLTAAVAAATGGGWPAVGGVIAGGALVAVSYRGIRGGVDAAVRAFEHSSEARKPSAAWRLVKFIGRLAMLALIAYVMMVRLRARPGWMLAGATSLVAAVGIEAVRQLRARP